MAEESLGVPIDDLRLISLSMESDYSGGSLAGTKSTVGFRISDREIRDEDGIHSLGVSLSVSIDTLDGPDNKKIFSANVKTGCSVHSTSGQTDEELEDAAVEACVGYARTVILSLAASSLANLRLSFPQVGAKDVRMIQDKASS